VALELHLRQTQALAAGDEALNRGVEGGVGACSLLDLRCEEIEVLLAEGEMILRDVAALAHDPVAGQLFSVT